MQDKILIIVVTRNNQVLLSNLISSIEKYNAGFDYDLIIADNSSTDTKHLTYLSKLSENIKVITCPNNRVEVTFQTVSKTYINDYKYFLFLHDDTFIFKDNWLKLYIDRLNSHYCEPIIKQTHFSHYPVGRVSACHQPYRDFDKCLGYPLPSHFLKEPLQILNHDILIYKYSDIDRTLYTQECLKKTGIWNLESFKQMDQGFLEKINASLTKNLRYPDEGMYPKEKYPPGLTWNKLTLLSEFFNCVFPLILGYRTIGLEGDGYLEQVHGFDNPFGSDFICHYGAPHVKKFLGTKFSCSPEDIHKKLYENNLPFIMKCNTMIREYFK